MTICKELNVSYCELLGCDHMDEVKRLNHDNIERTVSDRTSVHFARYDEYIEHLKQEVEHLKKMNETILEFYSSIKDSLDSKSK